MKILFIFCLIFICWGIACILVKFEDAIFGKESYFIGKLMVFAAFVYLSGLIFNWWAL